MKLVKANIQMSIGTTGTRGFIAGLLVFALILQGGSAWASKAGTASANFLKIGVGARGSAMGSAQSAVTSDVTSLYWNPAGLSSLRFQEISLMHYSLIEGVRYQQAGYGFPSEKYGSFAFGVNMLDYGSIQGYNADSTAAGNVDATNLLVTGSWGKKLFPESKFSAGATFKYLSSKLAGYSATAPMMDVGVLYPFETGRLRGLSLAGTIRNIGPDIKYDTEGSALPRQLVWGAGYTALGGNLVTDLDYIQPIDNDSYLAAGIEYTVFQMLALRAGYNNQSNFVGDGISYGMGLKFDSWNLDYAYVPFGDFGGTNRVSVGIRFGHAAQIQNADDQVERAYRKAERLEASGQPVEAYSTLNDILLVAPWHRPSVELKARIEKQFAEMGASKNKAKMEADIADAFTQAKAAFDKDELVDAKKGFETILQLQPDYIGAKVYLERIQSRYASLAHESFKEGMVYFAAGDYAKAKVSFEKTLTIDPAHADAKAQLAKTEEVMADAAKRDEEMKRLAGAADSYKAGLAAFQKNDYETALKKFDEVQALAPGYEEAARYKDLTQNAYANVLFEEGKVQVENGQLSAAVANLRKAQALQPLDARMKSALDLAVRDLAAQNIEESKKLYQSGLEAYLGGDVKKAEKLWRDALEKNPEYDDALKAITKLEEQKAHAPSKE